MPCRSNTSAFATPAIVSVSPPAAKHAESPTISILTRARINLQDGAGTIGGEGCADRISDGLAGEYPK
ncbi:hypothetical protein PBI_BOBI_99 [Mycobacterium phage Bobi]|uniref:hypothetical protein n=1 Tax=Mycobacterium phage Bobi TaxID=1340708 RepID=UPI000387AB64|nr:hypothetical protein PBI_BOBI_99 [Mycobacterium phage Bobi]AGS82291.1 hypothetical protein PBI_BOBI_99 [Mycobacterium phage Bobi]